MTGQRVLIDSTALIAVTFSAENHVLKVEFRNGLIYEYLGVSSDLFEQLLAAPSKGAFVVRFIRNRIPFRRVDRSGELTQ